MPVLATRSMPAALMLLGLAAVQAPIRAQGLAGSFDQLSVLVEPGDKVTVTGTSGSPIAGTIASLSASGLTVRVGKELRTFQEGEVDTVRHRRQDSLSNGALWGLGVGAGAGYLTCGTCHVVPGLLMAGVYGGIGAGIGVGIDALIKGNVVVFRRRDSTGRVVVTPQLAPSHTAVTVSMQW